MILEELHYFLDDFDIRHSALFPNILIIAHLFRNWLINRINLDAGSAAGDP